MKFFCIAFLVLFFTLCLTCSIHTCHSWVSAFETSSIRLYLNTVVTFLHSLFLRCLMPSKCLIFVWWFTVKVYRNVFFLFFSAFSIDIKKMLMCQFCYSSQVLFFGFFLYVLGYGKWTVCCRCLMWCFACWDPVLWLGCVGSTFYTGR